MSVFFSANIRMTDEEEYAKYLQECDEIFERFNGRYLAVDAAPLSLEGEWNYSRAVLIEFPCREDFESWYHSEDYQRILKHRLKGARCDTILIRGPEPPTDNQ